MNERTNHILEILTDEKTAEVASLAQRLQVSQVTIRKDLDFLENKGLIHREHGYARLSNPDNMNGRLAYHYEAKKEIAQAAAGLVQDGDTIMIESGSCCAILADTLSTQKRNLTIITNSAFIASYISSSDTHDILLGGDYQKDSQVNVGPLVRLCAENWCVWVGLMSLITFITFGVDKRRAVRHQYRISEKALLVISVIGGGVGGWLGMKMFHHKTQKPKFLLVSFSAMIWIFVIVACILNVI